jgi:flagellar motor switch protein FliG
MLIDFLVSAEESIKSKFIANMTNRTRSIVNEELQFAGSQTDGEKDLAIDNVLRMIKTLLGYI